MRRLSLPVLLLAVLLVPASIGLAALQRDSAREALDGALAHEAAQQRGALEAYFARARAIVLLTAQNPAFGDFYAEKGTREGKIRAGGRAVREANAALRYLERLYPQSIGEACFIDQSGAENARAVRGRVAPLADLSLDEAEAPFFTPGFALRPGQVHQARPYVSPDTREWVIANVTPAPGIRRARAIVHFEVTIESFRRAAAVQTRRYRMTVVDRRTGAVVIDGDRAQRLGAPLGAPGERRYAGLAGTEAKSSLVPLEGRPAALAPVRDDVGNANDWLVVATARAPAPTVLGSVGAGSVAMLALAGLLLGFSALTLRAGALRQEAETDHLTGLANRRRFLRRLKVQVTAARGRDASLALILIDLDNFKELNDALGHQAGDRLLEHIGPRLEASVPGADVLARLGGDEFALLLPLGAGVGEAIEAAEDVGRALDPAFKVNGLSLHVEASVGVAVLPEHASDAEHLLRRADIAMYGAKSARTGYAVYTAGQEEQSRDRVVLAADLRRALSDGEILLHFQPKADMRTGEVVGVEALVRWAHPERGLVSPADFIPFAEQTELIHPLTERVLDLALAQSARWREQGLELRMAVNISVANLLDARLPDLVQALLARHGVPAPDLQLEITESVIMADPVRAMDVLARVGEMGVGLSLDDFGTGYSSLSHLKRLPVQELKIDRSFVMNLAEDGNDAAIVRSAVDLARNLGLRVVAEGVETAEAWRALADMGCDLAQGYYLNRPVAAGQLAQWLARRSAAASLEGT